MTRTRRVFALRKLRSIRRQPLLRDEAENRENFSHTRFIKAGNAFASHHEFVAALVDKLESLHDAALGVSTATEAE